MVIGLFISKVKATAGSAIIDWANSKSIVLLLKSSDVMELDTSLQQGCFFSVDPHLPQPFFVLKNSKDTNSPAQ